MADRGKPVERQQQEDGPIEDTVVKIYRCAKVVKGGRRFSFAALVVVGDRSGAVGIGYGKANEVPLAVEKGVKDAKKNLTNVALVGRTIPHQVIGRFRATKVVLVPASPGTGVIAGSRARAVLEYAGVSDVLTKTYGSTAAKNVVRATLDGLTKLRNKQMVEELRGVSIAVHRSVSLDLGRTGQSGFFISADLSGRCGIHRRLPALALIDPTGRGGNRVRLSSAQSHLRRGFFRAVVQCDFIDLRRARWLDRHRRSVRHAEFTTVPKQNLFPLNPETGGWTSD